VKRKAPQGFFFLLNGAITRHSLNPGIASKSEKKSPAGVFLFESYPQGLSCGFDNDVNTTAVNLSKT